MLLLYLIWDSSKIYLNTLLIGSEDFILNFKFLNNFSFFVEDNNVKEISVHNSKHLKPQSDEELGHYLAGLIDGAGWFTNLAAHIQFHNLDASVAYYIKKKIGYGSVTKVKSNNSYKLTITKIKGLERLLNLINGKLRVQSKCDAVLKNILYLESFNFKENFHINSNNNLDNHWLAGFLDINGNFKVKLLESTQSSGNKCVEIKLVLGIYQNNRELLDLIKNKFGGILIYLENKNIYYYSLTSLGSARKIIRYLDKYHLLSSKHVNFLKWRDVYILIQNGKYLTLKGQTKIIKIKSTIVKY